MPPTVTIDLVSEFHLTDSAKAELRALLPACFPEAGYNGRIYYKQLPHHRLILSEDKKIIGQLGIDFRVMNLNNALVTVFGVIDLAVHPSCQGKGYGARLMLAFEQLAKNHANNIDFLFLVTDKPSFYERLGYKTTLQKVAWLKINEGKNCGLGYEQVDDCCLMVKSIGDKLWEDGELDMLGYWY